MAPHDVEIGKTGDESFGFYLWFDENGHYIEDVTIGSPADQSGLKVGDRVIEVNHSNVENEIHENVVAKVQESGDIVTLNVVSVRRDEIGETVKPNTVTLIKEGGSFGFYIQHDSKGFYFEYVQLGSPSDKAGISTGDRLLEVGDQLVEGMKYEDVFQLIRSAGDQISIVMQSSKKSRPAPISDLTTAGESKNQVYRQLLGQEEIDHVVEKRFLQLEYEKKHGIVDPEPAKRGTDLRSRAKDRKDSKAKKKTSTKVKFDTAADNVAFVEEEGTEMGSAKKKKRRRKKGDAEKSEGKEGKKKRKKRGERSESKARGESEAPEGADDTPKVEMTAEAKKEALQALRRKTKANRDAVLNKEDKATEKAEKKKKHGEFSKQLCHSVKKTANYSIFCDFY